MSLWMKTSLRSILSFINLLPTFLKELAHKGVGQFGIYSGLEDYMFSRFDDEKILNSNKDIKAFAKEYDLDPEDDTSINLCDWNVKKYVNKQGYQDIEVSIQLTKFHNEYCKVLCTQEHHYAIHGIFGYMNGIDSRRCDGHSWGVYVNLNIDHMYDNFPQDLPEDYIYFPWNRLSAQLTDEDRFFKDPKYFYQIFEQSTWVDDRELTSSYIFINFTLRCSVRIAKKN